MIYIVLLYYALLFIEIPCSIDMNLVAKLFDVLVTDIVTSAYGVNELRG